MRTVVATVEADRPVVKRGEFCRMPSMRDQLVLRTVLCLCGMGLLLAACSNSGSLTEHQRLHREEVACKLIGTPPAVPPSSRSSSFSMAVPTSLVRALSSSDNAALDRVAQELEAAGRAEMKGANGTAMVRALDKGVTACQRLGISTVK